MLHIGCVAGVRLQTPDEAGPLVGHRVDMMQAVDKFPDLGMVDRMEESPNVHLSEVVVHSSILAETKLNVADYDIIWA